MLLIEGSYLPI